MMMKIFFYFVHSYYIEVLDKNKDSYSDDGGLAMVELNNVIAMQFHPEKSDLYGQKIISKFIKICLKELLSF